MEPEPGHERVLTTFMSYGKVATDRQGEIIRGIGSLRPSKQPDLEGIADALCKEFQSAGAGSSIWAVACSS